MAKTLWWSEHRALRQVTGAHADLSCNIYACNPNQRTYTDHQHACGCGLTIKHDMQQYQLCSRCHKNKRIKHGELAQEACMPLIPAAFWRGMLMSELLLS